MYQPTLADLITGPVVGILIGLYFVAAAKGLGPFKGDKQPKFIQARERVFKILGWWILVCSSLAFVLKFLEIYVRPHG